LILTTYCKKKQHACPVDSPAAIVNNCISMWAGDG